MTEQKKLKNGIPTENKMDLLFLGLLSVSFLGAFAFWQKPMGFVFSHVAGLSIMGFYGCLSGIIAKSKGYNYWRAFQIGFFLPIILGIISAFLLKPGGERNLPLTCGGWISLGAGICVVLLFTFKKKRVI